MSCWEVAYTLYLSLVFHIILYALLFVMLCHYCLCSGLLGTASCVQHHLAQQALRETSGRNKELNWTVFVIAALSLPNTLLQISFTSSLTVYSHQCADHEHSGVTATIARAALAVRWSHSAQIASIGSKTLLHPPSTLWELLQTSHTFWSSQRCVNRPYNVTYNDEAVWINLASCV